MLKKFITPQLYVQMILFNRLFYVQPSPKSFITTQLGIKHK